MSEVICLEGELTPGGTKCQGFRDVDGGEWGLIGDLAGFGEGDSVVVCGHIADHSPCDGRALAVLTISKPYSPAPKNVKSTVDIDVEITAWSGDLRPAFKLEGVTQPLTLDVASRKWKGSYWDFVVTDRLEVLYVSKSPRGKRFEMVVSVSKDGDAAGTKKKTFQRRARAKFVKFDESVEVV